MRRRHVYVFLDRVLGYGRQNADDGMRAVIHLEDPADDVWVATVTLLPVFVAQHQHRIGPFVVIGRNKGPAENGSHSKNIKEVCGYDAGLNALRFRSAQKRKAHCMVLDHRIQRLTLLAVVGHLLDGEERVVDVSERSLLMNDYQLVSRFVWQRAHQHAVDDTEDRGVCADAERQRQHRNEGKAGIAHENARAIAGVLQKRFDQSSAPDVAALFLKLLHASEIPQSVNTSVGGAHATLDVSLDLHLNVE